MIAPEPAGPPAEGGSLIEDLELGHLGRLDVLDADLGGELLDDAEQIGAGGEPGRVRP